MCCEIPSSVAVKNSVSVVTSTRPVSTHGATLTGLSGLLSQKGEDMKKDGEHVIKMYCF